MALAFEVFAGRFAFLFAHFALLLADPTEFGNGEEADSLQFHTQRGGDAHFAGGRVDAEVDVLDVLLHDIYRDAAEFDASGHQYSLCSLTIKNMRSTSASFFRTS